MSLICFNNTQVSRESREMLDKKYKGLITQPEFELWSANKCWDLGINYFCYRHPPLPPQSLIGYEVLTKSSRWEGFTLKEKAIEKSKVYANPNVIKYYEGLDKVLQSNWAHAHNLERFIKVFVEAGEIERAREIYTITYKKYPVKMMVKVSHEEAECWIWERKLLVNTPDILVEISKADKENLKEWV
jgi:hypothetical protein